MSINAIQLLNGVRVLPDAMPNFEKLNVLVTGAGGTLGSGIFEALRGRCELAGLECREEALVPGVTLGQADHFTVAMPRPDIVFHCAAYKHVDIGEKFPDAFHQNNVMVTYRLCTQLGIINPKARVILASTDKAAGTSYMGGTKYQAEKIVGSYGGVSVRLVNIVRSRGSVVEKWEEELKRRKPLLKVVQGATRYWMQSGDAVQALLYASKIPTGRYTVWGMPKIGVEDMAVELWKMHRTDPVRIDYMPLRPGEVLSEELLSPDEQPRVLQEPWVRGIN